MEFSEILRNLRKEKGMNQEQFAEFCGLSRPSISRYESGAEISRDSAKKIAAACGIDINLILGIKDNPKFDPDQQEIDEFVRIFVQLKEEDRNAFKKQMRCVAAEYKDERKP